MRMSSSQVGSGTIIIATTETTSSASPSSAPPMLRFPPRAPVRVTRFMAPTALRDVAESPQQPRRESRDRERLGPSGGRGYANVVDCDTDLRAHREVETDPELGRSRRRA